MKILSRFILFSYLGPFFRSFGVCLFILVLQFLSRYKDQLVGKGLSFEVIFKIFGYASVQMMVLALPVSVLLASLFTMGTFGEQYELAAMRSGGMSVRRVLGPMIFATLMVAFSSFMLSSFVVPETNLKLYSLLYDVEQLKPTFNLEVGHFNSSVDKYVIRIEDKDLDKDMLYDVMIYDHTEGKGNDRMVIADSGYMRVDPYGRYMNMMLYTGASYETVIENRGRINESENFVRFYYDSLYYNFDISGFNLKRTSESAFASHHYMLNILELVESVDSIEVYKDTLLDQFAMGMKKIYVLDSAFMETEVGTMAAPDNILESFPKRKHRAILGRAMDKAVRAQDLSSNAVEMIDYEDRAQREYYIEFHVKFSLPMACILFLFIGAPLGALVRKGGVGLPIVISVVFYLTFYVVMIQGKKMAVEGVLPVWMGVWLPVLVMAPLAAFFTFQATSNSKFDTAAVGYIVVQKTQDVLVLLLRPFVRLFRGKRKEEKKLKPIEIPKFDPDLARRKRELKAEVGEAISETPVFRDFSASPVAEPLASTVEAKESILFRELTVTHTSGKDEGPRLSSPLSGIQEGLVFRDFTISLDEFDLDEDDAPPSLF